jgi:glycosyltransferase involved in cell wall biosynthesis
MRTQTAESSILSILAYSGSALIKSLRLPRPDLIHAFFGVPGGAVGMALKGLLHTPYVISFRGKDVHGGKSRNFGGITGILKTVSVPAWEAADALVANSSGLRDIARAVAPLAKVEVIPNGVDARRFTPPQVPRAEGPIRILFVGRLEPYKGVDTLLNALAALKQQATKPFSLRIAGDGSLKAQLIADAQRMELGDSVEFMGWISADQIPQVYQSSDIFVLPSVVEGMPNGVLESMSTGLPSIASRVPGTEELITDGETGITFNPGDVESMTAALKSLIEDDEARARMGNAARMAAIERSWEKVAAQYAKIYERVLGVAPKVDSRRATG